MTLPPRRPEINFPSPRPSRPGYRQPTAPPPYSGPIISDYAVSELGEEVARAISEGLKNQHANQGYLMLFAAALTGLCVHENAPEAITQRAHQYALDAMERIEAHRSQQ